MYFPRLFSETTISRLEWCCLVCLSGGCSQLQGLGDSWTHGNRRRRPRETRISLMEGLQRPGDRMGILKGNFSYLRWDLTKETNSPSPMTHFLKASSTMSPDPGLESHTKSTTSALKPPKRRKYGSSVPDALTLLLFPCKLLPLRSIHNPDLWLWHTPHSWDKDCSLQRRLGPDTGGCPPEPDPGDTWPTRVFTAEACKYESIVVCECSTWCNNMLLMGSCDGNRGISCSKVVFWSTTATRWSSPRSVRTNVGFSLHACPFNFVRSPSPLTCSEMQYCPLTLRLRHCKLGVCDTLPYQQGRCGDAVLHQGMVPHECQHLVWEFQGGLEPFSFQCIVQTL